MGFHNSLKGRIWIDDVPAMFEENLRAVAFLDQSLADRLRSMPIPAGPPWELDEVTEVDKLWAQLGEEQKANGMVLIGVGQGELLGRLLAEERKWQRILVYEPSMEAFLYALATVPMHEYLCHPRVTWVIENQEHYAPMHELFMQSLGGAVTNIKYYDYLHYNPAGLHEYVGERVMQETQLQVANMNTVMGISQHSFDNIIRNIPATLYSEGVKVLGGCARGLPALAVCPGPSMRRQLPWLVENQDRFVVIAVDTAAPILFDEGIVPDLIVGIDPMKDNIGLFKGYEQECSQVPLLALIQYTHEVVSSYPGRVLIGPMMGNGMAMWFMHYWENKGILDLFGGSVAHYAVAAAEYMGCAPVGLMGVDLCFTEDEFYAKKSVDTRLGVPEGKKRGYPVKNKKGEERLCLSNLETFRLSFENKARRWRGMINLSEDGMAIEGVPDMTPEEFLAESPQWSKADWFIKPRPVLQPNIRGLSRAMANTLEDLEQMREGSELACRDLNDLHDVFIGEAPPDWETCSAIFARLNGRRTDFLTTAFQLVTNFHFPLLIMLKAMKRHEIETPTNWDALMRVTQSAVPFYSHFNLVVGDLIAALRATYDKILAQEIDHEYSNSSPGGPVQAN